MAENTKIEWCDHSFNAWKGCRKVAPGCANCYAEALAKRLGEDFAGTRIKTSAAYWKQPLKWNRQAEAIANCNRPCVFCNSLADVFEDYAGPVVDHKGNVLSNATFETAGPDSGLLTLDDLRRELFALIDATPNLDWLILTKRPENIDHMWPGVPDAEVYRDNVWLLTSVSDQQTADAQIPHLLTCRDLVPVLGLSVEPLLGPVDLSPWLDQLDWIIIGGESGAQARPCLEEWERSIIEQCRDAGVPVFRKQAGSNSYRNGDHIRYLDSKGGDIEEWPDDLRVREFPR